MGETVLAIDLRHTDDLVAVRERSRRAAELSGLSAHDQVAFTAAVSEVARFALRTARCGAIELDVDVMDGRPMLRALVRAPGVGAAVARALGASDGADRAQTDGLLGARRLSDRFLVEPQSDVVVVGKRIRVPAATLTGAWRAELAATLRRVPSLRPAEELERQNHDLVAALDTLSRRTADVERLNAELAETNRGVLALYAELDDKAESLKSMSDAKSRFVSDVSHELRTPLNAIISLSGLLLDRTDGELTPEQETQITLIRRSAVSLVEFVSGMLDVAKIEAGKFDLRPAPVDVGGLLSAVRGMFRPLVPPEVLLQVDEPPGDVTITTDEGKLQQVVRNLVANALKFTHEGLVHVWAERDGDLVRLHVSDTGIGLAPDDHERIFHDFTQVNPRAGRASRGTGLGLPLARRLARLLGGDVTVDSSPGRGSTFTLTLPVEGPPHGAGAMPAGERGADHA